MYTIVGYAQVHNHFRLKLSPTRASGHSRRVGVVRAWECRPDQTSRVRLSDIEVSVIISTVSMCTYLISIEVPYVPPPHKNSPSTMRNM